MALMSVDLPTLGKPISPTLAISFSSSCTSSSSPGRPGLAKRGICRVGVAKCTLPQPPLPPFATTTGLVGRDVGNDKAAFGLFHQRAARHADDKVLRVFSVAARAAAVFAARRRILALIAEIHQGGKVWVGHKHNVAAAPAVAAVRPAGRHIFFPVERNGAVAALARLQEYFCGVDKHSFLLFSRARRYGKSRAAARPGFTRFLLLDADLLAVAAHALERDAAVHKGQQRVVAAAAHVRPGWMCVPRWRTRMLPARTNWPSPRFTPRRFDSESRPFL